MRSSLVVRASDCQCTSCNGPGFDPSIRRHSGIWGAADEAVLNIVLNKREISLVDSLCLAFFEEHGCIWLVCGFTPKVGFSRHVYMPNRPIFNCLANSLEAWWREGAKGQNPLVQYVCTLKIAVRRTYQEATFIDYQYLSQWRLESLQCVQMLIFWQRVERFSFSEAKVG